MSGFTGRQTDINKTILEDTGEQIADSQNLVSPGDAQNVRFERYCTLFLGVNTGLINSEK